MANYVVLLRDWGGAPKIVLEARRSVSNRLARDCCHRLLGISSKAACSVVHVSVANGDKVQPSRTWGVASCLVLLALR
eukprot:15465686-Alexandrium_andersonii.AAC.1